MTNTSDAPRRRGPIPLSELVGKIVAPVTAKRGFAAADLVAAWPDIAGSRFADCTRPEKIVWPRGEARSEQRHDHVHERERERDRERSNRFHRSQFPRVTPAGPRTGSSTLMSTTRNSSLMSSPA